MAQTTLRDAGMNIQRRESFKGNSIRGEAFPTSVNRGALPAAFDLPVNARYVVYSYATPIAWEDSAGRVTIPATRYSVTTSRHQSICRGNLRPVARYTPQISIGA
jgi:hypothetical protein